MNPGRTAFLPVAILLAAASCVWAQAPDELSGVVLHEGSLYLVGDDSDHLYFEFPGWKDRTGYFEIPVMVPHPVKFDQATDLESIAIVGDEVVVLSERSSWLMSSNRVLARYTSLATEFSRGHTDRGGARFNNGFEGLATRVIDPDTGEVMVAALWEGGSSREAGRELDPVIVQHPLTPGSGTFEATMDNCTIHVLPWQELAAHPVMNLVDGAGDHSFPPRASDLVWFPQEVDGQRRWSLIVHLSCSLTPYRGRHWLCRIPGDAPRDLDPLDLEIVEISAALGDRRNLNWEGLCWYDEEHDKLLLAADHKKTLGFFVLYLPAPWWGPD